MNNRFLAKNLLASAIICISFNAAAIPNNLPWPLKGKQVKDTTFFFGVDDSVDTKGKASLGCSGNRYKPHVGVDIIANPQEPVYAIYDGQAKYVVEGGTWGKALIINHSNNKWSSVYWHIRPVDKLKNVSINKPVFVRQGEIIGYVTSTSHMNDINHLHLGIATTGGRTNSGYLECDKRYNLNPYVNPYNYLSKGYHIILDDASSSTYHPNAWVESRTKDFYYGSGYRAIKIKNNPGAAARLIAKDPIRIGGSYNVYVRLTPDSNYTNNAEYSIQVNGRTVKTTNRSQRIIKRGENHLLFQSIPLRVGDKVDILVKNKGTGMYMAVDAYILIPR